MPPVSDLQTERLKRLGGEAAERELDRLKKFDYIGERRGVMAQLEAPNGHRVTLAVWPDTLLEMQRAGVLTGEALADAERLRAATTGDGAL